MIEAYWLIGKHIVEAQAGNERAEYGTQLLKFLSEQLTRGFEKGFTVTNLTCMRQFYIAFPIRHALRDELGWTHYRLILKAMDETVRNFYERLLLSRNKEAAQTELLHGFSKSKHILRR
ncbi:MAG: DUF1016 N-terminal domain-containing protein [Prevotellaceae bacterium]|jgi:hypothetical protein|nr:DUF1016 N-terminal domain-containing protein [Prevotellaceae bacterium]